MSLQMLFGNVFQKGISVIGLLSRNWFPVGRNLKRFPIEGFFHFSRIKIEDIKGLIRWERLMKDRWCNDQNAMVHTTPHDKLQFEQKLTRFPLNYLIPRPSKSSSFFTNDICHVSHVQYLTKEMFEDTKGFLLDWWYLMYLHRCALLRGWRYLGTNNDVLTTELLMSRVLHDLKYCDCCCFCWFFCCCCRCFCCCYCWSFCFGWCCTKTITVT